MIGTTREERRWFVKAIAQGLVEWMGAAEPPVPVEEMLRHPPGVYRRDFGVVDMYSNLWDATFARPPSRRGSVFVRIDLPPAARRYALAREALSAVVTSEHGKRLGLHELLVEELPQVGEEFAGHLLAPDRMVAAYRARGGGAEEFARTFGIPAELAQRRWEEVSADIV